MAWKRGQSGNPAGRKATEPVGLINPEPISIPILRRRDPANELVRLADASKSERFKLQVWTFLFSEKYKRANVVAKPIERVQVDAQSDEDLLRALETQTTIKRVKTQARGLPEPIADIVPE